uniref:Beta-1,4-galactosyltransferase n=1 Tax=Eptatretus burgeri TaxID=7764 RepID=A0A8C4QCS4_EPTBU
MIAGRFVEIGLRVFVFLFALHLFCAVLFYFEVSNQVQRFVFSYATQNGSQEELSTTTTIPPDLLLPNEGSTWISSRNNTEPCPEKPSSLVGPVTVKFVKSVKLEEVQAENPNVQLGGHYSPPCVAKDHVALIVPFRHREEHLRQLLHYLHPFLQKQQIDYTIYIVNQFGEKTFNRAKLMNVGYVEALKDFPYDCFIFSDVDLVPMDDRNLYHCYSQPRHFAVAMDKFGFRLPYSGYFGGVSGLSKVQFLKINGFPNNYWGWGGEDDDIYNRITLNGMKVSRPDSNIGRYRMIQHHRDAKNEANPKRFTQISKTRWTMMTDGLNSLKYQLVKKDVYPLYTNITVDIETP